MKKIIRLLTAVISAAAIIILCSVSMKEDGTQVQHDLATLSDMTDAYIPIIDDIMQINIMQPISDNMFGIDEPLVLSEAAYVSVGLYEYFNNVERSFDTYEKNSEKYINKALEYGIIPKIEKNGDMQITRSDAAVFLSGFVKGQDTIYTAVMNLDNFYYANQIMTLYNHGITINKSIRTAYSQDIGMTRGEMAILADMIINPEHRMKDVFVDYGALKTLIEDKIKGQSGDWSVYFEDYDTESKIDINSHQVYSASLIKLFVAQAVYNEIAAGTLSDSESTEELISRMITFSDNDAWKELVQLFGDGSYMTGMNHVTNVARESGFSDTGQFIRGEHKNYNFTSVKDCGTYMHKLLKGEIVSPEYSLKILNLLKKQEILHKIPAGVPDGIVTANKTGELEYVEGDVAIIYSPSITYILAVIGDELSDTGEAQLLIKSISEAVYSYLNT